MAGVGAPGGQPASYVQSQPTGPTVATGGTGGYYKYVYAFDFPFLLFLFLRVSLSFPPFYAILLAFFLLRFARPNDLLDGLTD